jgi:hypothetical protein
MGHKCSFVLDNTYEGFLQNHSVTFNNYYINATLQINIHIININFKYRVIDNKVVC